MRTNLDTLISKLQEFRDEHGDAEVVLEIGTANSQGEINIEAVDNYGEVVRIFEVKRH